MSSEFRKVNLDRSSSEESLTQPVVLHPPHKKRNKNDHRIAKSAQKVLNPSSSSSQSLSDFQISPLSQNQCNLAGLQLKKYDPGEIFGFNAPFGWGWGPNYASQLATSRNPLKSQSEKDQERNNDFKLKAAAAKKKPKFDKDGNPIPQFR